MVDFSNIWELQANEVFKFHIRFNLSLNLPFKNKYDKVTKFPADNTIK